MSLVICRGLCFQELIPPSEFVRVPFLLTGANCEGNESALTECAGVQLGRAFELCSLSDALNLQCFSATVTGAHVHVMIGCAWGLAES